MNRTSCCLAFSLLLLAACGGQAAGLLDDGGGSLEVPPDAGGCLASPCPSNAVWNPATCQCEPGVPQGKPGPDAATTCPPIVCPTGTVQGVQGTKCACISVDSGIIVDSAVPIDAPVDVSPPDATQDVARDVTTDQYRPDVSPPYDAFIDVPPFFVDSPVSCDPTSCGQGYIAMPGGGGFCYCTACTNACPSGQTPAAGCGGCTACSAKCPTGFVYGSGCNCGPPGTNAGPNTADGGPDGGGVTCMLQGYTACTAGSWCQLGVCPDGTTQYGCYCNPDGTANCSLTCPIPPPCTIPGEGTCAYGSQCVFGDCAADASAAALVCSCNSGGSASCYTSSCSSIVQDGGADAGDGGVTCLLEGSYACSAGSWCQLGICPDNTTPYGCTCNADGTATCRLTCPTAACTIPGEGTCPVGMSCMFGTCNGSSGTQLSCYCYSAGNAYCNTISCAEGGRD
jgi:hypothetical protein